MSDCCSSSCDGKGSPPRKFTCPINHEDYISVSKKTILHHIKSPWDYNFSEEQYYFCDDPDCEAVYFGLEGSVIKQSELRTRVGIKEKSEDSFICYCFGVSRIMAKNNSEIKSYVTQQTKEKNCACDTRNPSGRCCLKDFL